MTTIAIRDKGGQGPNKYKLVINGDKPTQSTAHGATKSPNPTLYQNNAGMWCVQDAVYGGTDAWEYADDAGLFRMAVSNLSNAEAQRNDYGWKPVASFNVADQLGDPDGDGSNSNNAGGSGGNNNNNNSGGSSNNNNNGGGHSKGDWGGTPRSKRKHIASASHGSGEFHDLSGNVRKNIQDLFSKSTVGFPAETDHYAILPNGDHDTGTLQMTFASWGGDPAFRLVGNPADPESCVVRGNVNIVTLCKDEHYRLQGMLMGRTQFAGVGQVFCWDMVFTDRSRPARASAPRSSIGGKPARVRMINCQLGLDSNPDEYAGYFYGSGRAYFDRDNTFRATGDAYFGVNNDCALIFGPRGRNNFASGRKEVVEGTGIHPNDLHAGRNTKIENGTIVN